MNTLRVVVILQALLLAARCRVRGSNPEEGGQEEQWKRAPDFGTNDGDEALSDYGDVSGTLPSSEDTGHAEDDQARPTVRLPEDAETHAPHVPVRTGNRCAFVYKRAVSVAVACGTEKYIIKSQKPCSNGEPDCQLVIYTTSTRPVYRQKQKIFTALQWRCCSGHHGPNCEETDSEPLSQVQEQSDYNHPSSLVEEISSSEEPSRHGHADRETRPDRDGSHVVDRTHGGSPPPSHRLDNGLVPIHYLKDVLMSHLQPVLDSFNLTLGRLSEEVRDLQRDMGQLQLRQMLEGESGGNDGGLNLELQQHEDRLSDTMGQVEELKLQLIQQRDEVEEKLHAQRVMIHHNLTHIKTDVDVKMKRKHKLLQMSLQSLNSSLSEMQEKQEQLEEELQSKEPPASAVPHHEPFQTDAAIWEAIVFLENKVVNNTRRLDTLSEGQAQITEGFRELRRDQRTLTERLEELEVKSKERHIEAFLEIDGAKEAVKGTGELVKNISAIQKTLQKTEDDVDHLFINFYRNVSSAGKACDCEALGPAVAELEQVVAHVSILANENKMALSAEDRLRTWDNGGWSSSVETLKSGLLSVQDSLTTEREKLGTLQQNMSALQNRILGNQLDIEVLQQQDRAMALKVLHLSSSFDSLIQDGVRNTKVLEVLLDAEVFDFLDLAPQDWATYSIPALRTTIEALEKRIARATPSSDEPWDGEDRAARRSKRRTSETDILALRSAVGQLKEQVVQFGEQRCLSCCCTGDADSVTPLHRRVEDHLRRFHSIFGNTEGLSEEPRDLTELAEFIRQREPGGATRRSKQDASLDPAARSQGLMFLASSSEGRSTPGTVVFETAPINLEHTYSPETGRFRAPAAGVYLFILTLDLGPGAAAAHLLKGRDVVATLRQRQRSSAGPATRISVLQLQQGEEVQLRLVEGAVVPRRPQDNTFAGLLLLQTT